MSGKQVKFVEDDESNARYKGNAHKLIGRENYPAPVLKQLTIKQAETVTRNWKVFIVREDYANGED